MLKTASRPRLRVARHQQGLSLVELMVGIAIGLFIVAAAVLGVTTSLKESRMLLLEARLQQDLRAAMDLITRDVRRAGYWGNAADGMRTAASVVSNPYASIAIMPARPAKTASTVASVASATGSSIASIAYNWDIDNNNTLASNESYNFRLQDGRIQMLIGGGQWQDLTDPNTIEVTAFSITPTARWIPLYANCPKSCDPLTQACPELAIRSVTISITGQSAAAVASSVGSTGIQRTLRSNVRIRNDEYTGSCPT